MLDLAEHMASYLPPRWHLSHLSYLDPAWQAVIRDDEHFAFATGGSIEEALSEAGDRALKGQFSGRIFEGLSAIRVEDRKLDLASLAAKPKAPVLRRI